MSVPLDPRYTFDSFVVGPGNRLAAAAGRRAAESPGTSYNPLVFYSGPGLGKTHLLNAVGQLALSVRPELKVQYEPLEGFVDRLTAAMANATLPRVREEYTGLGLLLLDDVQFLAGKTRTQEELLRIWDEMSWRNSQIVLASDRPPQEIDGLDERLISRFSGGLIVDIAPPDPETRVAIITRKAAERGIELAGGVAEALARLSFDSVRDLQGGLNRVLAIQEVEARRVSPEEVAMLLGIEHVRSSSEDEFNAFLSDISFTVAELVETAPWRKKVAEAILRWEGEGIRTRRLEDALEADSAPDVDVLLHRFASDVDRLFAIEDQLHDLESPSATHPSLRDPDRLAEAETLVAAVLAAGRPFDAAPEWATLARFEERYGAESLAARASRKVVDGSGTEYNPLFVHGPAGAGKTTLVGGLAALASTSGPAAYCRASELVAEAGEALRMGATELWRGRYQRAKVLVMDDAHEMEADARIQEEIFHLVDALLRGGTQIVIAADRAPRMLTRLDARLRSRFEGGLVVEVSPDRARSDEGAVPHGAVEREIVPDPGASPASAEAEEPIGAPTSVAPGGGSGAPERAPVAALATAAAVGSEASAGAAGSPTATSGAAARPKMAVPSPVPLEGSRVDSWFFNGEKIAWSWLALDDRLIEELH
jgi:chromosomal replication initiator protein